MKRLAAVALVATLAGLTFTGCEADTETGSCQHAASAKATNLTDWYGTTHSMAETFVWTKWVAFNNCTQGPLLWLDWHWSCESWDYPWSGNTQTVADSCWQTIHDDDYGKAGTTAYNQATYESHDGFADLYQLKARVHAAADGWIYWYCGRSENLNGGGTFGWVSCDFNADY